MARLTSSKLTVCNKKCDNKMLVTSTSSMYYHKPGIGSVSAKNFKLGSICELPEPGAAGDLTTSASVEKASRRVQRSICRFITLEILLCIL
jgi:hypothetical protein